MNRRQFITSTAIALPSVTLLGAISTQPTKTYRSPKSVFTNEEYPSGLILVDAKGKPHQYKNK